MADMTPAQRTRAALAADRNEMLNVRDALIAKQAGEIALLQRDNEILALGIGECLARLDALEKAVNARNPYAEPPRAIEPETANNAVELLRRRVA
jgi:hypothetical protein